MLNSFLLITVEGKECMILPNDFVPAIGVRPSEIIVMMEHAGIMEQFKIPFTHKDVKNSIKEDDLVKYGYVRPIKMGTGYEDVPSVFKVTTPGRSNIAREVGVHDLQEVLRANTLGKDAKVMIINSADLQEGSLSQLFRHLK